MGEELTLRVGDEKGTVHRTVLFWTTYTAVFILCAASIYIIFSSQKTSFLWMTDGLLQHYTAFSHLCDFMKGLVTSKASLFSFSLGQGADAVTTLNSYNSTDPVYWLAAVIKPLSRVGRYTLALYIKLYLTGAFFILYCTSIGKRLGAAVACGALTYAFSSQALFVFARHPNFMSGVYCFPLILAGIEFLCRKQDSRVFVGSVVFSLFTDFYTFYMNVILAVIYVLSQCVCNILRERSGEAVRREIRKILAILGSGVMGVFLSAVVLLPTLYAFSINTRVGGVTGDTVSLFSYTQDFIKEFMESLFTPSMTPAYRVHPGFTTITGVSAAAIIPLSFLFSRRRENTLLKYYIILTAVLLCVPAVGILMNGFGYATNRWSYALVFYVALAVVAMYPRLSEVTPGEKGIAYSIILTYVLFCFLVYKENETDSRMYTALWVIVLVTGIFAIASRLKADQVQKVFPVLLIAGILFLTNFTFGPKYGNYISEFSRTADVRGYVETSGSVVRQLKDDSFYRVEAQGRATNTEFYNHYHGTTIWWSMLPKNVYDYYTGTSLCTVTQNCNFKGLDGRVGLMALAGVKYYTVPKVGAAAIPYGFEKIGVKSEKYLAYRNDYALPLGYLYNHCVRTEDYEKLNGVEREYALLKGAVIDEKIDGIDRIQPSIPLRSLPFDVAETDGVTIRDNRFESVRAGSTVKLTVDVPEGYGIYFSIDKPVLELDEDELITNDVTEMNISVARDAEGYRIQKIGRISNRKNQWFVDRKEFAYNLGSGGAGENTITLGFDRKGTVSFSDCHVYAVPMDMYRKDVSALRENTLKNISVSPDKVEGIIDSAEKGVLQFSIPYGKGWTAYVDGKKARLYQSGGLYMAVAVGPGTHRVELDYCTPYLKEGAILSGLALALYIAIRCLRRRKRNRQS